MEQEFHKGLLSEKYGLDVQIPTEEDRTFVHETLFRDLCLGKIQANARTALIRIIDRFAILGAKGVILGCTEIGMLVSLLDTLYRAFVFSRIDESSFSVHK
jgi:aspartate racemase